MSSGDFLQILSDAQLWVDHLYLRQATDAGVPSPCPEPFLFGVLCAVR